MHSALDILWYNIIVQSVANRCQIKSSYTFLVISQIFFPYKTKNVAEEEFSIETKM